MPMLLPPEPPSYAPCSIDIDDDDSVCIPEEFSPVYYSTHDYIRRLTHRVLGVAERVLQSWRRRRRRRQR